MRVGALDIWFGSLSFKQHLRTAGVSGCLTANLLFVSPETKSWKLPLISWTVACPWQLFKLEACLWKGKSQPCSPWSFFRSSKPLQRACEEFHDTLKHTSLKCNTQIGGRGRWSGEGKGERVVEKTNLRLEPPVLWEKQPRALSMRHAAAGALNHLDVVFGSCQTVGLLTGSISRSSVRYKMLTGVNHWQWRRKGQPALSFSLRVHVT